MAQPTLPVPDKAALRREALTRRGELGADDRARLSEAAAVNAMTWLGAVGGEVFSLFVPIGSEISTYPLAALLRAAGAKLALPVVSGTAIPLVFRLWEEDVPLVATPGPGTLAIPAPPESALVVEPDVLVVPLAAFDARGHRLGYGGGYYDRTLSCLRRAKRVEALGYAFAVQELPMLPAEPHDEPLDAIATDAGIVQVVTAGEVESKGD